MCQLQKRIMNKHQKSNNGDTLEELESSAMDCLKRVRESAKLVTVAKTIFDREVSVFNSLSMELLNLQTRIQVWKNEMGMKQ